MTGDGVVTVVVLAFAAAGLLLVPERTRRPVSAVPGPPRSRVRPVRRAVIGAAALGLCGMFLVPQWWWLILPLAALVGFLLARGSGGSSPASRAADRRFVAVYAELLASCLDAGMAVAPALRAVSAVLIDSGAAELRANSPAGSGRSPTRSAGGQQDRGPLATLDSVAAMLSLGADPRTAWRMADLDELVAPLGAAACRSAAGGGGLADAVREHAAQLRQEVTAASVRAAGRAGVLMTAPLGVCFLPAFLCLGLAPVVIGLLGQLDIF